MLGGGMDHSDKDYKECLKREVLEETGIKTMSISERPLFIVRSSWPERKCEKIDIVYEIELESLNFRSSDECIELKYFTVSEARALVSFDNIPPMLDELERYLRG